MKLTRSRTLAEAARSPAGPAFVDVSLSPSFKLKSIPKLFLSEEGEERRKLGGGCREGSSFQYFIQPKPKAPRGAAGGGGGQKDSGISPRRLSLWGLKRRVGARGEGGGRPLLRSVATYEDALGTKKSTAKPK